MKRSLYRIIKSTFVFGAIVMTFMTAMFFIACNKNDTHENNIPRVTPDFSINTPAPDPQPTTSDNIQQSLDLTSNGGSILFQNIGAPGWYPSPRDPNTVTCDAYRKGTCCMAKHVITTDSLAPWNEDLTMTLRGPMLVKQFAVYQPNPDKLNWSLASLWHDKTPAILQGIAFKGNGTETTGFNGIVGNKCLVDVSTNKKFPCGPNSVPYCNTNDGNQYYGWEGSKLIILQASMPHMTDPLFSNAKHCSVDKADNWYDAPWIGLSHGELIRIGKFSGCNCYGKDPVNWAVADGCGQFNVFETVNDNNTYQNFDLFSTNFFAYHGYIGEGPCGKNCNVTNLNIKVDLINKANSLEASTGSVASPQKGPGTAFRRPLNGYRYFIILMDMQSRSIQLAEIHPASIPTVLQTLLPSLPAQISRNTINDILTLRLPGSAATGIFKK